MDSKQILHTSKDQQMCFVGDPETWNRNPRWWTTIYLPSGSLPIPARPLNLIRPKDGKNRYFPNRFRDVT